MSLRLIHKVWRQVCFISSLTWCLICYVRLFHQVSLLICVVTPEAKHSPSVCLITGKSSLVTQPTLAQSLTTWSRKLVSERDSRKVCPTCNLIWTNYKSFMTPYPFITPYISLSVIILYVVWLETILLTIPTVCGRFFFFFFILILNLYKETLLLYLCLSYTFWNKEENQKRIFSTKQKKFPVSDCSPSIAFKKNSTILLVHVVV